jgi:hypothetical protein
MDSGESLIPPLSRVERGVEPLLRWYGSTDAGHIVPLLFIGHGLNELKAPEDWCPLSGTYLGKMPVPGMSKEAYSLSKTVLNYDTPQLCMGPVGYDFSCRGRMSKISLGYLHDHFFLDQVRSGAFWRVYLNVAPNRGLYWVAVHCDVTKKMTHLEPGHILMHDFTQREFVLNTQTILAKILPSCVKNLWCSESACVIPHRVEWVLYQTDEWITAKFTVVEKDSVKQPGTTERTVVVETLNPVLWKKNLATLKGRIFGFVKKAPSCLGNEPPIISGPVLSQEDQETIALMQKEIKLNGNPEGLTSILMHNHELFTVPKGSTIPRDDVAKAKLQQLRSEKDALQNKLKQKNKETKVLAKQISDLKGKAAKPLTKNERRKMRRSKKSTLERAHDQEMANAAMFSDDSPSAEGGSIPTASIPEENGKEEEEEDNNLTTGEDKSIDANDID